MIKTLMAMTLTALTSQAAVLISVQDQTNEHGWQKKVCERMYGQINSVIPQKVSCLSLAPEAFADKRISELRNSGSFHTHLRFFRTSDQKVLIDTTQWKVDDESDFTTVSFKIEKNPGEEQLSSIGMYSRNWAAYRLNRFNYKADILLAALPESKELKRNSRGEIVETSTLNPIDFRKAYAIYSQENLRQKKYLKTAVEISAVLGFGVYLYYKNLGSMKVDHDYEGVWPSIKKKLSGEAVMEDDNNTAANIGHVFAGEIYFLVARNSGLNFIESSLATLAASAAWEFGEYKEVFSIGDQILTGWTGAVVGEVFWQIARAVKNKSNNPFARLFAGILDPVSGAKEAYNSLLGYKSKSVKVGDLDLAQISKFEFTALTGRQTFKNGQTEQYKGVQLKAEVINIPSWDRPGTERKLLLETPVAELEFTMTKSRFGTEDFRFISQAVLAGVYDKNRTDQNGYEYLIGLSSGFQWDQKRSGPLAFEKSDLEGRDMWARAHLIGSTVRAIGLYKGIKFSLEMKVHADYVMVSSYALEELERVEGGRDGLLSVMKKRGYYYGTGFSQGLKAAVEYNDWQLGFHHDRTDVRNSGFKHRFDNQVTKDYRYTDQRAESRVFVRKIINKEWSIEVAVIKVEREGQISNLYEKKDSEKRSEIKLSYIW